MNTSNGVASRAFWPTNGLAALFDFAASSHRRAAYALVFLSLIAFLPGVFQLPPVDRDEARFAQATKQMIESGDYIDIRFQGEVRYKKPVGIYWLQAAVVKTAEALGVADARTSIWLYRIPSVAGAVGAVLATYWCALALASRRGAMLAATMMMGSILLGVEARLATTDAALLLTVIVAMGVLARTYLVTPDADAARPAWYLVAAFWTALGAGILLKGPVIVMIVALACAALSIVDRSGRWLLALRPLPGVAWLLLLVLPWFIAIYARAGNAFLVDSAGQDMLAKVVGNQENHGAPPGLYFVLFFATFFPGSVLAGLAAPAVWSARRERATRFLLAWLCPSWIVFELVVTKLPHYVMPLYPAIAILIARVVETRTLSSNRWLSWGVVGWAVVPIIGAIAAVAAAMIFGGELALPAWPFLAAAAVSGLLAWRSYADGVETALTRALVAVVLLTVALYALVVPELDPLFPSRTLAGVLRTSGCPNPIAVSVGYEEPSLVFLAGTATRFTNASAAADFLHRGDCRFAFIEARQQSAFALRAQATGLRYDRGPRVSAFNYSNGERIEIAVFRSVEAP